MTPAVLLATLHAAGVVLTMDGPALRYRAPTGVMTAELLQDLSRHKAALLTLLTWRATVAQWPPDVLALWEERAAIMQYEGGLSQEDAEWRAFLCVHGEASP